MGILDTLTGAASATPMGALLNVGSKILDRVLPDPAANAAAKAPQAMAINSRAPSCALPIPNAA